MNIKNARLDFKTTQDAKAMLEQAANVLGITLSSFVVESAMAKAREVLAQTTVYLTPEEAQRFLSAVKNPPKPNAQLKHLFKKYSKKTK